MHPDQVELDVETVRSLVADQFPALAQEPIAGLQTSATTSHVFRVGDRHAALFRMQREATDVVRDELDAGRSAMERFAAVCPVPAPELVAIGEPGRGYPMPWSVQTWVAGGAATPGSDAESSALGTDLAELIATLRATDTAGRVFFGAGRGGVLTDHDDWVKHCLARSTGLVPVDRLRAAWASLRETPRNDPDVMSHTDLIPPNLLVEDGRLVGVIDTGSFGPADPALDLVVAWHLLDDGPRAELRRRLGVDDDQWRRGAAWALEQALGLVWYYESRNPPMGELGRSTVKRLLGAHDLGI